MVGRRSSSLLAAGLLCEAIYAAITVRLPWWRYGGRLQSWSLLLSSGGAHPGGKWLGFAACVIGIAVLMGAYLWGWRVVRGRGAVERRRRVIWVFPILFSATLVWLLPITSDAFTYLSQAHQYTDHHSNPLLVSVLESASSAPGSEGGLDPLIAAYATQYSRKPSVYGPAWALVASIGTLGPYDLAGGFLYLKVVCALAYLASAWLLERILSETGEPPESVLRGLYLFAWNPLVVLLAVGDAHNDILMMAAVLLAVLFLVRRAWALAFGALALSVWVKYVSVIFLPLFALFLWFCVSDERRYTSKERKANKSAGPTRGILVLARTGLAVSLVSLLVLLPFGPVAWGAELTDLLLHPANWREQAAGAPAEALIVGLLAYLAVYLVVLVRLAQRLNAVDRSWRRPGAVVQPLLDASFAVTLMAFLFAAVRSQPWHLLWAASLASLSSWRWAWPVVGCFSALMLVGQAWVEWGAPGVIF